MFSLGCVCVWTDTAVMHKECTLYGQSAFSYNIKFHYLFNLIEMQFDLKLYDTPYADLILNIYMGCSIIYLQQISHTEKNFYPRGL